MGGGYNYSLGGSDFSSLSSLLILMCREPPLMAGITPGASPRSCPGWRPRPGPAALSSGTGTEDSGYELLSETAPPKVSVNKRRNGHRMEEARPQTARYGPAPSLVGDRCGIDLSQTPIQVSLTGERPPPPPIAMYNIPPYSAQPAAPYTLYTLIPEHHV